MRSDEDDVARISLDGKVAIVTGASRGIGASIARTFAAHGASVVVAARPKKGDGPDALAEVAASCGPRARAIAAHTGRESDCAALVRGAVDAFGRVDILVNNAATNPYFGPMLDIDDAAWDKTFEVNLKGYFWMSREVARHIQGRGGADGHGGGAIVNVASVAGLEAAPLQGVYGMTKAAIVSMTKSLAYELAGSGIRVNAVAPGLVDTRFASAIVQNDALVDEVKKKTMLHRYGTPREIAGGVLYLASEAASFLTGHTLVIDGGMTVC